MSIRISSITAVVLTPLMVISPLWAQAPVPLTNSSPDSGFSQPVHLRIVASEGPEIQVNSHAKKGFIVEVTDATGAGVSDAAVVFRLPDSGPTGIFEDGSHSAVAYTDGTGRAAVTGIQWTETPGPFAVRITATKGISHAGLLIDEVLIRSVEMTAPQAAAPFAIPEPALPSAPEFSASAAPVPGTIRPISTGASSSPDNPPAKPALKPSIAQANQEPSVSVTSASSQTSQHSGTKKWLIIAAIAAGAGVGAAMTMKGKSSTPAAAAPALSIGSPTVSIGHP